MPTERAPTLSMVDRTGAIPPAAPTRGSDGMERVVPIVFVLIWATGFVVARLVRSHADPLFFLAIRFAISAAVFAGLSVLGGAAWPRTRRDWGMALLTGVLMQGCYLGGIFWATEHGLPAAVAALITGLQPLVTAMLAYPVLKERVSARRWLGIVVGFAGAMLVVSPALATASTADSPALPVLACLGSMLAITVGTLAQKRTLAAADLRTHACGQFMGATLFVAVLAWLTEGAAFDGTWQVWFGLGWGVLALSVGAALLLLRLIRGGAVAAVASLFYLTPPVVAVMAYLLFGDQLAWVQVVGMVVAAAGVFVANRG